MSQCCEQCKIKKICTVLGVCLLLAPSTVHFIWGNLSIYVLSYIHRHSPDISGAQASWVTALYLMMQSITLFLSGYLIPKIGKRATSVGGVALFNIGILSSYFTIEQSIALTDLSLGAVAGVGGGLLYGASTGYIVEWSGEKDIGKNTAFLHNSYNIMAIVVNQIVSLYINPHDELPESIKGSYAFFVEREVLDRVPTMFLILGACFLVVHVVGLLLVRENPSSLSSTTPPAEENLEKLALTKKYDETSSSESVEKATHCGDEPDYGLRAILRSPSFHFIWIAFFTNEFSFMLVSVYYKAFGQLWIDSDYFLTEIGTAYLILIVLVKPISGVAVDKLGFKTCLIFAHGIIAVCGGFLYIAPGESKWLYFVLVILLVSVSGSVFLIDAVGIVKLFGRRCAVMNIGLLSVASLLMMALAPFGMSLLLDSFGWACLFATGAVFSTIALVLVIIGVPVR